MNPTIDVIGWGRVDWQGQLSLLEALEDAEVDINHSCRSGACGACRVRLRSGRVSWVQQPSVSLASGEILACCTKPVGDIQLELD